MQVSKLDFFMKFVGPSQRAAMREVLEGEERAFMAEILTTYTERVNAMPKTYEQDGLGQQAVAYLHYFSGGCDWYITEKDMEPEQLQAFGSANLGYGAELGYISIVELLQNGVELDLYFTPKTLAEINRKEEPMQSGPGKPAQSSKPETPAHILKIHSLHDGIARCSCGTWNFVSTGETTNDAIEREHYFHVHREFPETPAMLAETPEEAQRMAYGGRSLPSLKASRQFDTERLASSPLFERRLF